MRRAFCAVFLALDALLVLLFVVGYAARYVHPRYGWGAELVAIGLPYLSVGVVAVLGGALAARRWRLAAVHAILALLVAVRFLSPGGLPRWERPGPEALALMTFNVPHWSGGTPGSAAGASRAMSAGTAGGEAPATLEAFVRRARPDLIALQETRVQYAQGAARATTTAPHLVSLIDTLGYGVARVRGPHRATALPVLGRRLRLLGQEHRPLPGGAGPDTSFAVRTRFVWQGREAVLYNLHLRSFGRDKPWEEERLSPWGLPFWRRYLRQYRHAYRVRAEEAEAVRAMIDRETLPVIVAGDFNSTPHSWVYATLAEGMQDAYKAAGWGWGATYHARLPFVRIDFVLAGPAWEVLAAEVPSANLSDHRPLLVHLRWRDER